MVKKVVENQFSEKKNIEIIKENSSDNRSYHINSDKIKEKLNFIPKRTIEKAVEDLCEAFRQNKFKNTFSEDIYFNINRMKNINAK